jgi:parallel beta-helix repeat protein
MARYNAVWMARAIEGGAIVAASVAVVALLVVAGAPQAQAAVVSCPVSIAKCGCTITDNATHTLANDISAADGLTSAGNCIEVKHSFAILECDDFEITGAGAGDGVKILKGALRSSVQDCDITGWGINLEDDANFTNVTNNNMSDGGTGLFLKSAGKNMISDFDADDNTGTGIVLKSSNGNALHDFDDDDNGGDGATLTGSNGNNLSDCDSSDNGGNGVTFVKSRKDVLTGCDEDDNAGDGVFIDPSSNDRVNDGDADENGKNGIEIAKGSTKNAVSFEFASGNGGDAFLDGNTNCDKDVWTNLCIVGTASPSCIVQTSSNAC